MSDMRRAENSVGADAVAEFELANIDVEQELVVGIRGPAAGWRGCARRRCGNAAGTERQQHRGLA